MDDNFLFTAEIKLPTLTANMGSYGSIVELKHPWIKRRFKDGVDGNQMSASGFVESLISNGYEAGLVSPDEVVIKKGSFSLFLVLHYPAFSDSTIHQIDYIFKTMEAQTRQSMKEHVARLGE